MTTDVRPVKDTLIGVHNAIVDYIGVYKNQPSLNSKAITELGDSRYHKAITNAYSQSGMQLLMACDQAIGLSRALTEPMLTITPWTCASAILELTALGSWLVDPAIGVKERAERSYALRFEGIRQQKLFAVAVGEDPAQVDVSMENLKNEATSLGLQIFTDDREKTTGIGVHWRTFTDLTKTMLDEEATYRLFSAMTHGHLWAATKLGFHVGTAGTGSALAVSDTLPIDRKMPPLAPAYLCVIASNNLLKLMEYKARLFGWDEWLLKEKVSPHTAKLAAVSPKQSTAAPSS